MEEILEDKTVEAPEITQASTKEERDLTAILSYFGILFLVPLLACRNNAFAQFHAKQGMVLFIAEVITITIAWIPILGWLVGAIAWIIWLILAIIGIINVVSGKQVPLPIIGRFAGRFEA